MSDSMNGFTCWNAKAVRETVHSDIGSLPSAAEAVFLAAHSSMTLSHLKGAQISDAQQGEQQVLDALRAGIGDPDRNTLIAVTGAPGSGKSHVVRWVHAHLDWTDERYHILYVPRAVQTVRSLLRSIVDGLPDRGGDEGQKFMAQVDQAVGTMSSSEFQDRLRSELILALTWTLEPKLHGPDDEDDEQRAEREERNDLLGEADSSDDSGKRRHGLADLLALPLADRALLRSGGRLNRYAASIYKETSRRDEGDDDRFTEADLPLSVPGMRSALGGDEDLLDLWAAISCDPEPALRLLGEALDNAAPRALGMRGPGGQITLEQLFRKARQVMHSRGKELVLLFEDLAQFGLIDGELYDQFATQPTDGLCPLRVVFAVTNQPYRKLPETVTTRIAHQFEVESSAFSDRTAFVARYLNLVRIGRARMDTAWAEAGDNPDWIPNACDDQGDGTPCPFRDACHDGFGSVDIPDVGRVGLYPFNNTALRRSLDFNGVPKTPRAVLDHSVTETLDEAETHLRRKDYPHARVASRFEFEPRQAIDMLLRNTADPQADRLYRALVIWGDEEYLHPVVAKAFSLDISNAYQDGVSPQEAAITATPVSPLAASPVNPPVSVITSRSGVTQQPSPVDVLVRWRQGRELPDGDSDDYRVLLAEMVRGRLGLDRLLIHTRGGVGLSILNDLLSRRSFTIDGSRGQDPGEGRIHFRLFRNDSDLRVLIAARWFRDNGHWLPAAGLWAWPSSRYDPADLMIELESRLEEWAERVRQEFLTRVCGRGLAQAAVGVRAIAMLSAGVSSEAAGKLPAVMRGLPSGLPQVTLAWRRVDEVARDVLGNTSVLEAAMELAGVRQGSGDITLLDSAALEAGLIGAISTPIEYLAQVIRDFAGSEPILAQATRSLHDAIMACTIGQTEEVVTAIEALNDGLKGHEPEVVAKTALKVGNQARTDQVFRPRDGWGDFADAIQRLPVLAADLPTDWTAPIAGEEANTLVQAQHWCRQAIPAAKAIRTIRDTIDATTRECERRNGAARDLARLRRTVQSKLDEAKNLIDSVEHIGGSRT